MVQTRDEKTKGLTLLVAAAPWLLAAAAAALLSSVVVQRFSRASTPCAAYYLVEHRYQTMGLSAGFIISAAVYAGLVAAGVRYRRGLAAAHFLCMAAGATLTLAAPMTLHLDGLPRRYGNAERRFVVADGMSSLGSALLWLGLCLCLTMIVQILVRWRRTRLYPAVRG